jgi:hypothetical protein
MEYIYLFIYYSYHAITVFCCSANKRNFSSVPHLVVPKQELKCVLQWNPRFPNALYMTLHTSLTLMFICCKNTSEMWHSIETDFLPFHYINWFHIVSCATFLMQWVFFTKTDKDRVQIHMKYGLYWIDAYENEICPTTFSVDSQYHVSL